MAASDLAAAIVSAGDVAPTLEAVCAASGMPTAVVMLRLTEAVAGGWLEDWEADGETRITLTPWTAAQLGVQPSPGGGRWVPFGAAGPNPRVNNQTRVIKVLDPDRLNKRTDLRQAEPWRILSQAEDQAGPGFNPDSHRFSVLYGLRPAWPILRKRGRPCPVCGSRRMSRSEVCLVCDRSGVDHLLPSPESRKTRKAIRFRPKV